MNLGLDFTLYGYGKFGSVCLDCLEEVELWCYCYGWCVMCVSLGSNIYQEKRDQAQGRAGACGVSTCN